MAWWLQSPAHCEVLMSPGAREVGIGLETDPETSDGYVWVMLLGR